MGITGIWYWGLAPLLFFLNAYSSGPEDIEVLPKHFLWKKSRAGFEGITCGRIIGDFPTSGKPYERLFSPFTKKHSLNDNQYEVMFEQFGVELHKIFTKGEEELSVTNLVEAIKLSGSSWVNFYAQDIACLEMKYRSLAALLTRCVVTFHKIEMPAPA